ncbi:MAG: MFS transporter, partial [Candidatus Aenigmarchaeota archaeon]|nr:MFS transporter [Candidatus Aenigmarchaeota archaeon]
SLGSAIGVFSLGFLISVFLFDLSFLFFSIIPMIGFLLLFKLKDLKVEQKKTNRFMLVKKSFTSITALRLSSIWFAVAFVFGLVIGIIPLQINTVLGMSYVGILFSIFHILPVFLSYFFGKLSDVEGREKSILFSYILLVVGLIFLSLLDHPVFLILGIFLFALNRAIIIPITSALVGDVSTKENLEYLTALFWMVQNTGVVSALILSQIFKSEIGLLYLISSLVIIGSLIILLPLMHKSTKKIREQIQSEVK